MAIRSRQARARHSEAAAACSSGIILTVHFFFIATGDERELIPTEKPPLNRSYAWNAAQQAAPLPTMSILQPPSVRANDWGGELSKV
jgi:hypothetical protein